jgi:hypothetical protein
LTGLLAGSGSKEASRPGRILMGAATPEAGIRKTARQEKMIRKKALANIGTGRPICRPVHLN